MYHLSQYHHIFLLVDIAMYDVPKQKYLCDPSDQDNQGAKNLA